MNLKEKIIHESLRQFSTKGFMSTSINDIIKAVGTSKGGFYNHFKSKEELFFTALNEAWKIWRQKNLAGLDQVDRPLDKIKLILENYRQHYLPNSDDFPGGCIFVSLAVELNDQQPHLASAINEGFEGFKGMLKRLLDQEKESGAMKNGTDTEVAAEMIFAGILGSCVAYAGDKSREHLDQSIEGLISFLEMISR